MATDILVGQLFVDHVLARSDLFLVADFEKSLVQFLLYRAEGNMKSSFPEPFSAKILGRVPFLMACFMSSKRSTEVDWMVS